jgi:hypothetical protein
MENNALDNFLQNNEDKLASNGKKIVKKNEVLKEKDGLFERVDKKFIVEDGRQLLKEQLHESN